MMQTSQQKLNVLWDVMGTIVKPTVKEALARVMQKDAAELTHRICAENSVDSADLFREMKQGGAKHRYFSVEQEIRRLLLENHAYSAALEASLRAPSDDHYLVPGSYEALKHVKDNGGENNVYTSGVPFLHVLPAPGSEGRVGDLIASIVSTEFEPTVRDKKDPSSYRRIEQLVGASINLHINDSMEECIASARAGIKSYNLDTKCMIDQTSEGVYIVQTALHIPELMEL